MGALSDLTEANAGEITGLPIPFTDGADLLGADATTGFNALSLAAQTPNTLLLEDDNGDTETGDPFSPPHGFLTRPRGWER